MKQTLKKLVALLLVFALLIPVFAGGRKDTKGTAAVSNEPVDIEIWYGAAASEAGPPPADWEVYKIVKDKLNINLTLTALPSSQDDQNVKINAAGAADALPDLFMVDRDVWLKLVQQGLVAEVDDMYSLMPTRTKTHYTAESVANTTVDGVSYGLADPGSLTKNEGLLIRKDWLDNLGLSVPKTLDDLYNCMYAFTYNDPDGNGRNDTYGFGAFLEVSSVKEGLGNRFEPIMGAFGVPGTWDLTKAGAGLNLFKSEYFDAITFVKKMVDNGVIDPNWTAYKKDDFRAAWKQGKFGIMREQNAAFGSQANYKPFDDNFPNASWIVLDAPVGPNGKSSIGVYANAFRIYAVSQTAADAGKKAKIAELLEWMATDGYYLLGWGHEGVNFVFDENGVPTEKGIPDESKGFSKADMIPLTQLKNMVFYNSDVEIAARYPAYITATSKKRMSAGDVLGEMEQKQWTPNNGNSTMPSPNADLKRFYEQGVLEFLNGTRALTKANWDAWIAEFKNIGGQAWNDNGVAYAKEHSLLY